MVRNGLKLADLAAERGVDVFDLMVDISLAEHLETRFRVTLLNDGDDEIGALLRDQRCLLGLSDAGAHTSQLCDAGFSTNLLGPWCRDQGQLTLEHAVWRLTGQPAQVFGLHGRGRIDVGAAADMVAFDPATVGPAGLMRRFDLPGGAARLVSLSRGIEHVWVGGTAVRRHGEERVGRLSGTGASGRGVTMTLDRGRGGRPQPGLWVFPCRTGRRPAISCRFCGVLPQNRHENGGGGAGVPGAPADPAATCLASPS